MKNIHVLPTDKPSRLIMYSKLLGTFRLLDEPCDDWKGRLNIYITSDEEIKEGDWCYVFRGGTHRVEKAIHNDLQTWKKIILSTDQDLIKDGVQAIKDEFLEWFVKNPSCEKIKVQDGWRRFDEKLGYLKRYKIIIPKEEPKQEFLKQKRMSGAKTVSRILEKSFKHKVESLSTEEVLTNRSNAYEFIDFDKQETLEEAASTYVDSIRNKIDGYCYLAVQDSFEQGAKWQQEQNNKIYSELVDLLEKLRPIYKEDSVSHFKCEKQRLNIIEQFKNK